MLGALTDLGLTRDVKTIYVSYTSKAEQLVAAVHPNPLDNSIEVALSIPLDHEDPRLYDATHLKWRTLPVALRLKPTSKVTAPVMKLFQFAVEIVESITPKPPEDFFGHRRRGRYRTDNPWG